MRIAIIGAHRVGKTTLAEKLCEHLPGYKLYREPYYELEDTGYLFSESPEIEDFITQFDFSVTQIPKSEEDVIFDRCPIDLLAYIHALDKKQNIQAYYKKVQELSAEIDLLVFVPIETPDRIGCLQSDLPALRYKVNEILSEWIWDFDILAIEVNGTLPSRIRQVLNKTI